MDSSQQEAEIARLRQRIAELESQLATGEDLLASLNRAEAFLNAPLDGLEVGVSLLSIDLSQAIYSGMVPERFFGCTRQQMDARPDVWLEAIDAADRASVRQAIAEARDGAPTKAIYRVPRGDEVYWVRSRFSATVGPEGRSCLLVLFEDITDLKHAQTSLAESELRFRLLSDYSPVGIFLTDQCGQLIYANPRLEAIFGYSAQEQQGLGFMQIIRPESRDAILASWLRIACAPALQDVERRIIRKDGSDRWVQIRSAPMIAPDGAVIGRVGTVEDITERRQAVAHLRRSEERHRVLAQYSTDLISKHTADGTYLDASPACLPLLGYEREELIGTNAYAYFHPDDIAMIAASHRPNGDASRVATVSYRIRRKDGSYIWLETLYQAIGEPNGPAGADVIAVSRDVTARREVADRLSESEARLRGIVETAPDGIISVNEAGTIELFNPGAERLFGYRADEVLRKDLGLLLPECYADASAIFPGSTEMLRAMGSETRELVGRRKDGTTCDLELRVGETRIGGRTIFTGILHDIGERKRTQQMLHESEKLAASGRIAARIAHEINNPLAGIKNSFLLIKDAIAPDHPYFSYVARIESEIARIARVVRQMFDLYRPDQTTLREIDLSETIGDVVALLRTIAPERGVSFDVATSQVTGRVRLPEDSIRQVLYNIVINAIEASPVNGKVKIQATIARGMLTVLVTDQGPGIPDELRSQVYEPFFTTKAHLATGGLGLGLPISRGIVEAMRGTLEFASGANEGTAVRVRIPLPSHDPEQTHDR